MYEAVFLCACFVFSMVCGLAIGVRAERRRCVSLLLAKSEELELVEWSRHAAYRDAALDIDPEATDQW